MSPLHRLAVFVSDWHQLSVGLLLGLVFLSALGVVYSSHQTRQLYSALQEQQRQQDYLDSEYEKLLLEQSAWADYTRVDQLSREELNMLSPDPTSIVVVRK
ncbi:MAG: cell division protein FtsL [Pseudomonadota bacterium]